MLISIMYVHIRSYDMQISVPLILQFLILLVDLVISEAVLLIKSCSYV